MKSISLFFVRWAHKYAFPKYCGLVPAFQFLAGSMAFFYVLNYPNISKGNIELKNTVLGHEYPAT